MAQATRPPTNQLERVIALLETLVYQRSGYHVSIEQYLHDLYAAYYKRNGVVQHDAGIARNKSGAEAFKDALNERDRIAVFIHHG